MILSSNVTRRQEIDRLTAISRACEGWQVVGRASVTDNRRVNPMPALEMMEFLRWLAMTHDDRDRLADADITQLMALAERFERLRDRSPGQPKMSDESRRLWEVSLEYLLDSDGDWNGYNEPRFMARTLGLGRARTRRWWTAFKRVPPDGRRRLDGRLERLWTVPLHAVPLYSSEDEAFASYLIDHWDALDRLSGDRFDLHPSLEQLRGREDVYALFDPRDGILAEAAVTLDDLPGLLFWEPAGATCYVSFRGFSTEQIKYGLRSLVDAIQEDPSIRAVRRARGRFGEVMSEDSRGPVFHQHVYGGAAAQGVHVTQNAGLQPDDFVRLCHELREFAMTIPGDQQEEFLGDVAVLENPEETPAKRLSAGRRIRAALTSGGTKVAAAAIVAGVDKIIAVISG